MPVFLFLAKIILSFYAYFAGELDNVAFVLPTPKW